MDAVMMKCRRCGSARIGAYCGRCGLRVGRAADRSAIASFVDRMEAKSWGDFAATVVQWMCWGSIFALLLGVTWHVVESWP